MQVIELDSSDDIVSVCDRLVWAAEPRVLFVLPVGGDVLRRSIDQVRLRRCADGLRIDVALVVGGGGGREEALKRQAWARQAWAVGIPTFGSITAARRGRRHWRPQRTEKLGFLTEQGWQWPERVQPDLAVDPVLKRRRRLSLYLVVLLAAALFAGALFALTLLVPIATVTLRPISQEVEVSRTITADPMQTTFDPASGVVPAQLITQTLSWSAEMDVDGIVTTTNQQRLRTEALQGLETAALKTSAGRLSANRLLLNDSLRVVEIHEEDYSAAAGTTADRLVLHLSATVEAAVLESALVNGVVYQGLLASLPVGYELLPSSLQVSETQMLGQDSAGRFTFNLVGTASAVAELNIQPLLAAITGQPINEVAAFLSAELPLQDTPSITLRPAWWAERIGRLPFRPTRIEVQVVE